ncbi:glycosyl transferase group 1 [Oscillochloris trichoides DG-6]|uniref:Glycosyl transferase group 1 n=1 Tax=Oscillochloris trichoides DG-6 TaxID=765420 RepID=E1II67_9CHLR|nr:glycosyltransferase [Oscillochloris trichoides]EFO79185.1 glycosyl transferase group 1 [Oscillochloris trichoides DG-6]
MHILHIYKDYYPVVGGIENHLRLLAEGLVARGHQVTVLTNALNGRGGEYEVNGVRVVAAGRLATLASAPLSPALLVQMVRQRPDLVHLHMPDPTGDLALALVGPRTPLVVSYHSDIVRQRHLLHLYAPLLRRTLRRATRIIVSSPAYQCSSPFLAAHQDRCVVVPYGIELARFAHADPAQVAAIRARYPGPLSLFVGRLRYYKGVEYLIRALVHAPGQALIIGADATVRRADLHHLAQQVGVAERVHFLQAEDDAALPAYFHAADLFVLPSIERSEAFGIVQIEAQAAALPVITSELGTGTSYVTLHGQTGIVVPPADPLALARAMRVVLENPNLARAWGAAGRQRAQMEFDHTRMLERIEALYADII